MFDLSLLNTVLILFGILFLTIYYYVKQLYSYWTNRGIPQLAPTFPFGNFGKTVRQQLSLPDAVKELYQRSAEPIIGVYSLFQPQLIVRDLELIRCILIKDFHHFTDRGVYVDEENDPISGHLFALEGNNNDSTAANGDKWKNLRMKLTPTFTSGKMKAMFLTTMNSTRSLLQYVIRMANSDDSIDIREMSACFATNLIASVAFGTDIDCFADADNPFRRYGRKIFQPTLKNGFRLMCFAVCPKLLKLLGLRFLDRDVEDFMFDVVKQMLLQRENGEIVRKDFFQLLIQLRNTGTVQLDDEWKTIISNKNFKTLTIDQITAQAFLFYLAGFETTSTTISFCLYEIAKTPAVQQRVHSEIDDVLAKSGGEFTYDSINKLSYLHACIDETLRLYPPLSGLSRQCTKEYKIPGMDITLEKGTNIVIPVIALQHDAKYWSNPDKFDPERFLSGENNGRTFTDRPYFPFGDGPRNCVGMRMGRINTIAGVAILLEKFHFDLDQRHIGKQVKLSPKTIIPVPIDGIHLKARSRSQ